MYRKLMVWKQQLYGEGNRVDFFSLQEKLLDSHANLKHCYRVGSKSREEKAEPSETISIKSRWMWYKECKTDACLCRREGEEKERRTSHERTTKVIADDEYPGDFSIAKEVRWWWWLWCFWWFLWGNKLLISLKTSKCRSRLRSFLRNSVTWHESLWRCQWRSQYHTEFVLFVGLPFVETNSEHD